ncbi:WD domain, G-beta repeat-containing protein [Cardiosporidium cionae]|uniref:WD domain, G-beta repeat-containing protein n=1 Tax=Cardiosporidium cionae TaxID=476202 RepID=A0ABQ7JBK6_9APIC|nr:WD domain, G-beta repeat-containing protein [Cardiosporidium cionae]|eukprot:KAF8821356.1 WD domain, G-beta repeat-containing protein [Cardiosporidium cionae]
MQAVGMNLVAGCPPPSRSFTPLPFPSSGNWEPIVRLGGYPLQKVKSTATSFYSTSDATAPLFLTRGINRVRFSPDGRWLATAGTRGELSVWDVECCSNLLHLPFAHADAINDFAWHTSSAYIYTVSSDQALKLFSLKEASHSRSVQNVFASSHTSSLNQRACSVNTADANQFQNSNATRKHAFPEISFTTEVAGRQNAHAGAILSVASPHSVWGGSPVYTGGYDELMRQWDLRLMRLPCLEVKVDNGPVSSIEFSSDDRICCTASFSGHVRLWHAHSLRIIRSILASNRSPCSHALFSLNNKYLLCTSTDETSRLWSMCATSSTSATLFGVARSTINTCPHSFSRDPIRASALIQSCADKATSSFSNASFSMDAAMPNARLSTHNRDSSHPQDDSDRNNGVSVIPDLQEHISGGNECISEEKYPSLLNWSDFEGPYVNLVPYSSRIVSLNSSTEALKLWWADTTKQSKNATSSNGKSTKSDNLCQPRNSTPMMQPKNGNPMDNSTLLDFPTNVRGLSFIEALPVENMSSTNFDYCPYSDFWRDRVLVPAQDGCLHVYHALTGIHEHQLLRLQHPSSFVTSVSTHPNHNLGIIATATGEPDGAATLWMFVPERVQAYEM